MLQGQTLRPLKSEKEQEKDRSEPVELALVNMGAIAEKRFE